MPDLATGPAVLPPATTRGTLREVTGAYRKEGRIGIVWPRLVRARLNEGELPFSSAEIMPVVNGAMTSTRQEGRTIHEFADRTRGSYAEVDGYGRVASEWAQTLARRARRSRPRR